MEDVLSKISEWINELKETGYTDTGEMESRYSVLITKLLLFYFIFLRLSSLESRVTGFYDTLKGFLSSVDEWQLLLTEADSKLRECEKWLIINGKFAENQLIIEQISEYQVLVLLLLETVTIT